MTRFLLVILFLNIALTCSANENEIPAGYIKLHSGAIVPIEDVRPASGNYLNAEATPHEVYFTPATKYNPRKNKIEPKFTGFLGKGFNFFNLNAGNFNFGVAK